MPMPKLLRAAVVATVLLGLVARAGAAGEPRVVAAGGGPAPPCQPQVAVDDAGTIHVAWGSGDRVFHRAARAGEEAFGGESSLSLAPVMALGMRRGPRVAASGGSVCITAIGGPTGKGRDGDVWAVRSTDGGASWSAPVRVNAVEGSAREGLHGLAAGPDGAMCCVWLDLRNGRTEIMAATSADGGATWTRDALVYRSPEKSVCECCHPAVAYDGRGDVWVQWRNSLSGNRDMFVARSRDGGRTFGEASKLGRGTWPLSACPMDGGAIAVDGGKVASAWRRDRTVYLVEGTAAEERALGTGEQPWIAGTPSGPAVAWVTARGGTLLLLRPGAAEPVTLAEHAADPVLATGTGPDALLVAVWEERDAGGGRVLCRVIGGE